jgi:hypothetical protein
MKHYLELAGKPYPIQFGYGALLEYERETGKSALELVNSGETFGFTDVLTLIACGLSNGAEVAGGSEVFTSKSVARLLDETENSPAVIQKAMSFLQESFAVPEQKKTVKMPTANRAARRKTG